MRPLRGWTGGQATGEGGLHVGGDAPDARPDLPSDVQTHKTTIDISPDPVEPGEQYAQAQLAVPAVRLVTPYVARGLGALLGLGAGIVLHNEGQEHKPPDMPETEPPSGSVTPRSDVFPQAGGRSGEFISDLKGPPNSAIPAAGPGRIFITDETGKVVVDLTRKRAKVRVGGRWEKRVPTPGEIELPDKMGR